MFSKVRMLVAGAAIATALTLTACGGAGTGGGGGGVVLDTGDGLQYVQTALTLPATGGTVTFNNKSAGLQHNFVLANGGDDVAAQVNAAGQANATTYVAAGDPNVVVNSALLNSGANEAVTVPALAAGTYTYLCTYPGHYDAGMKGVLT
ncbi:MAG: auracyanin, partial [Roseiflexaceae bacterium]|nr:auracyanin [Roseiflexaceae bacterium]